MKLHPIPGGCEIDAEDLLAALATTQRDENQAALRAIASHPDVKGMSLAIPAIPTELFDVCLPIRRDPQVPHAGTRVRS